MVVAVIATVITAVKVTATALVAVVAVDILLPRPLPAAVTVATRIADTVAGLIATAAVAVDTALKEHQPVIKADVGMVAVWIENRGGVKRVITLQDISLAVVVAVAMVTVAVVEDINKK